MGTPSAPWKSNSNHHQMFYFLFLEPMLRLLHISKLFWWTETRLETQWLLSLHSNQLGFDSRIPIQMYLPNKNAYQHCVTPNLLLSFNYRPHPKDGEGNVFTLSTPGGGSGQSSRGGGGQVSPARGGVRSVQPGGGGGQSSWGGGQSSCRGGSASCTLLQAVCLLHSRRRTFLFIHNFAPSRKMKR